MPVMSRVAVLFTAFALSVASAGAQHVSRVFDPGYPGTVYSHNDSTMEVRDHRGIVEISYMFPRAGLPDFVQNGIVLFEGARTPTYRNGAMVGLGDSVSGTAYVFSTRCGEIPYHVSGRFTQGTGVLTLSGPAPVLDTSTCSVRWYNPKGVNAHLVFVRDRRPFVE